MKYEWDNSKSLYSTAKKNYKLKQQQIFENRRKEVRKKTKKLQFEGKQFFVKISFKKICYSF